MPYKPLRLAIQEQFLHLMIIFIFSNLYKYYYYMNGIISLRIRKTYNTTLQNKFGIKWLSINDFTNNQSQGYF